MDNTGTGKSATLARVGKRVLYCLSLALIAAVPSYLTAVGTSDIFFDHQALVLVVAIYVSLAVVIACLPSVNRLLAIPFMRRTFHIAWAARLIFTLVPPLGFLMEESLGHALLDWTHDKMPGEFFPVGPGETVHFQPTFVIAMLDGAVNVLLLVAFIACVWAIQLLMCKRLERPQGFPVETRTHDRH